MAKTDFGACISFYEQAAEGTFSPTIDHTAATGLLLGTNGTGIRNTGITLGLARAYEDKALLGATLTRGLSDLLYAEAPTLTFQMPMCGNRGTASTPVVIGDIRTTAANDYAGMDALLAGCGFVGADSAVTYVYSLDQTAVFPISAQIYYYGNRLDLKDCRTSLSFQYEAGAVPQLVAAVAVGSVDAHALDAYPAPTYGVQASVAAAKCIGVNFDYIDAAQIGGFSNLTIDVSPTIEEFGDSNNTTTGKVKEVSDREVKVSGTIWADDADVDHSYTQMVVEAIASLSALSFQVGTTATDGSLVLAHAWSIPNPEVISYSPVAMGSKSGVQFEAIGRGDAGDDEATLTFL